MGKATLFFIAIVLVPSTIYSTSLDTIKARQYLNEAIQIQKKFKSRQALPLLKKSLSIYLDQIGEHSEEVSDVYLNLGNCYLDLAEYGQALDYLQRSLEIRLRLLRLLLESGWFKSNVHKNPNNVIKLFGFCILMNLSNQILTLSQSNGSCVYLPSYAG